jgi:hypothetical protein
MMKQFFLQLIMILVFLTPAFAFFEPQPDIQIYPQPDSPLQLSNPLPKWRISIYKDEKVDMLTLNFVIKNVGQKNIRAYAIRYFTGDFKTDTGGTLFSYSISPNGVLTVNKQNNGVWGEFSFNPQEIQNLKLAVDFVEFTDGTTWGMDISKSAEQFAGVKAGTKVGREYLQKISRQDGIEASIKAIDEIYQSKSGLRKTDRAEITGQKRF